MNPRLLFTGMDAVPSRQRGVVLVVSLLILLIMTIIGVTAMQGITLDERMAGNLRDRTLAFEAAEAALRDAAALIVGWSAAPHAGSNGVFKNGTLGVSPKASDLMDANGSTPAGMTEYTGLAAGVARNPRYAIEEVTFVPFASPESGSRAPRPLGIGDYYYSVTALGFGSTTQSRAMLQAVVTRRFN